MIVNSCIVVVVVGAFQATFIDNIQRKGEDRIG